MHNEECAVGAFPCEAIHNRYKAELIRMRYAEGDEESCSFGGALLIPLPNPIVSQQMDDI